MAYYDKLKHRRQQADIFRENMKNDIMNEFYQKKGKKVDPYNKDIFNKGMEWYYTGLEIADADEKIRDNTNFIRGFELASRQDKIRRELEELGAQWFYSGNELDDNNQHYRDNEFFIKGYNDAKNNTKRRS